ncbi:MAG: tRNA (guanosine(37)-N1)-methyltransferase TrmD [Dehalococcoidia bacterium]|nr:tRNA (guanosine(37)-N1)-methyltransferase TrmD [Dehalococcoidia bacterium]
MKIHVITLFPDLFPGPLGESIIGRALDSGVVELYLHNLRDHGEGPHKVVDDTAFGGGPGMVLKAGPLAASIEEARHGTAGGGRSDVPVVLMDPQGERLTQQVVDRFAGLDEMIIIAGRYEGIDERVRQRLVTHEVSIGDYVLTGGELPAMVFIEAIARRVPGVLGGEDSGKADSFASGLLQHPQYTRPAVWEDEAVPEILLSGDHARVDRWRREQSLLRTLQRRPDLLNSVDLLEWEREFLRELGWQS